VIGNSRQSIERDTKLAGNVTRLESQRLEDHLVEMGLEGKNRINGEGYISSFTALRTETTGQSFRIERANAALLCR